MTYTDAYWARTHRVAMNKLMHRLQLPISSRAEWLIRLKLTELGIDANAASVEVVAAIAETIEASWRAS